MILPLRIVVFVLALSFVSAMGCQSAPLVPVEETLHVQFDSRPWIKAFQDKR